MIDFDSVITKTGRSVPVQKGDIVRVLDDRYIPFHGGKWCDHFEKVALLFKVIDIPNNNGRYKAIDSRGKIRSVYEIETDAVIVRDGRILPRSRSGLVFVPSREHDC